MKPVEIRGVWLTTTDSGVFHSRQHIIVDKLVNEQFKDIMLLKLAPGILIKAGSSRMSPDYLLQAIEYNCACGILGEVFFFYEGLREDNNALAQVLHKGSYAQEASFPSVLELNQGIVKRV